jgi:hypothetical protein
VDPSSFFKPTRRPHRVRALRAGGLADEIPIRVRLNFPRLLTQTAFCQKFTFFRGVRAARFRRIGAGSWLRAFAVAGNVEREIGPQKVDVGESARFRRLEANHLNPLVRIRAGGLKVKVLSVRPPYRPAARLRKLAEARAIGMDNEHAAGKTAAGTEANPLSIGRPARNRTRIFNDAPRHSRSIGRCNVET